MRSLPMAWGGASLGGGAAMLLLQAGGRGMQGATGPLEGP